MHECTNLECTSHFLGKNDFLLFCSSVNSGLHNYGHETTDQAESTTLMTITCSNDVEGFACTDDCAFELKHASLN